MEVPFVYKFREEGETKMSENVFGLFKMSLNYLKKALKLRFEG